MARHFSDWIKAYCDLLDGKTEAPRRFHFWSAVSCLAGALTRKVVLDETTYRYYPNFYIFLVSPPGVVKKTSTIYLALDFLRRLKEDVIHVNIGPDISTSEGLTNYISELKQEVVVGRTHGIPDMNAQCACTLIIGEFGNLYKKENTALINLLTDLYDCSDVPLWKHTKTQGDDTIINPFMNIIAGTTPRFLQDEFGDQVGGWGLSSRIIFIYCNSKERYVYRPSKLLGGNEYIETREKLYEDLKQITQLAGEYSFTKTADAWAEHWYMQTERRTEEYVKQDNYSEWVAYFLGRKQVHVHKLAMVLAAARRDDLMLHIEDLQDAAAHVDEVERELPAVFAKRPSPTAMAQSEQVLMERVLELLAPGPLPRHEVITRAARFVDSITATRLLESAIARKLLSQEVRAGTGSWIRNGHAPDDE